MISLNLLYPVLIMLLVLYLLRLLVNVTLVFPSKQNRKTETRRWRRRLSSSASCPPQRATIRPSVSCNNKVLMGPRWKGNDSKKQALQDPMSKSVLQLRKSLKQSDSHGQLSGCSVLLKASTELAACLEGACFGRPCITAEKDCQLFLLGLEEAFYLSHILKCLRILGEDGCMKTDDELWISMKSRKETFPNFCKAYTHLRMKNWVVRSGSQYGVDYVAYRHHPALVHSEYAVLVLSGEEGDNNGRLRVWSDFHSTVRVCGSVAKTLLVLNINSNGHTALSQSYLEGCTVDEYTITRWSPEQHREDQKIAVNGSM